MRHQIIQLAKDENGAEFKISVQIPFELGWIERVKLNVTTKWQKNVYQMKHVKNENDEAYFETTIRLDTCAIYHYCFSFEANGQFQYYKKENTSGNHSVTDAECWKMSVNFDVPEWAKGAMMYHIFVDRYRRTPGLKKEIMPKRRIHNNWYEPPVIEANEDGEWNVDFHCGDLKGITDTIKYIQKLGVTILYLSPIVKSQSTHRYDAADYMQIDPYAGTSEMLAELCDKAHKHGMKVVLDAVFDHTGNDSIYFNQFGTYDSIGAYQVEKDEKYKGMESPYSKFYKKYCHYGEHYFKYWWNMDNMPACDDSSEEWRNFICGPNGVIDTWFNLGIDGLRLDVADEFSDEFVGKIHDAATRNKPDAFILGEVWDKNPMNRGFISSAKGMHSIMDYELVDGLIRFYKYSDIWKLDRVLNLIFTEYPTGTIQTLMNFTSTHDISRAIEIFGGDNFNQYSLWGWDLQMEKNNPEWIKKHDMTKEEYHYGKMTYKSYCFALTFLPGIFSIFYGDEVGLKGIGNLATRAPYPWGKRDKDLLKFFRKIGKVRKEEQFLRTAEFKKIKIDHDQFVFERYNEQESIIVFVSRTHTCSAVDLPEEYKDGEIIFKLKGCNKEELQPYGAIAVKKK